MIFSDIALIPLLADAGLDTTIASRVRQGTCSEAQLLETVNAALGYTIEVSTLLRYLADRKAAGAMMDVQVDGAMLPAAVMRQSAPTELGHSATDVYFGTPDTGEHVMRFWVNGVYKAEFTFTDCAANRSYPKALLGTKNNDVVQLAEVADGVIGWVARIAV